MVASFGKFEAVAYRRAPCPQAWGGCVATSTARCCVKSPYLAALLPSGGDGERGNGGWLPACDQRSPCHPEAMPHKIWMGRPKVSPAIAIEPCAHAPARPLLCQTLQALSRPSSVAMTWPLLRRFARRRLRTSVIAHARRASTARTAGGGIGLTFCVLSGEAKVAAWGATAMDNNDLRQDLAWARRKRLPYRWPDMAMKGCLPLAQGRQASTYEMTFAAVLSDSLDRDDRRSHAHNQVGA